MLGVGCTRELTSEPAPSAKQCLRQSGAFGKAVPSVKRCLRQSGAFGKAVSSAQCSAQYTATKNISLRENPGRKLPALVSLQETQASNLRNREKRLKILGIPGIPKFRYFLMKALL